MYTCLLQYLINLIFRSHFALWNFGLTCQTETFRLRGFSWVSGVEFYYAINSKFFVEKLTEEHFMCLFPKHFPHLQIIKLESNMGNSGEFMR